MLFSLIFSQETNGTQMRTPIYLQVQALFPSTWHLQNEVQFLRFALYRITTTFLPSMYPPKALPESSPQLPYSYKKELLFFFFTTAAAGHPCLKTRSSIFSIKCALISTLILSWGLGSFEFLWRILSRLPLELKRQRESG